MLIDSDDSFVKNIYQLNNNDVILVDFDTNGLRIPYVIERVNYHEEWIKLANVNQPVRFRDGIKKLTAKTLEDTFDQFTLH